MNEVILDVQDIRRYLPHRYPFLLIDRIIEINEEAKTLVAIKNLTVNEPFFNGHFPGKPVMPGVLMIEALAQASGVLAYKLTNTTAADGVLYYLAGIDKVRFKRMVVPGDQLRLSVQITKARANLSCVVGTATVNGELACSAEIKSFRAEEGPTA